MDIHYSTFFLPIDDASIDGIITSPPYSVALNYVENDAHALKELGYDLERIKEEFIGVRGLGKSRFELYEEDMGKAYAEMARVIKPSGKAAVIIGSVHPEMAIFTDFGVGLKF